VFAFLLVPLIGLIVAIVALVFGARTVNRRIRLRRRWGIWISSSPSARSGKFVSKIAVDNHEDVYRSVGNQVLRLVVK
jgi:hypothetical protein